VIDKGDKAKKGKARAPEQTFEEVRYIKHLIDNSVPICVKLLDNEEVRGIIEYYDHNFIRVTREQAPNLFIYKHEIKYFYEA
jgi:sRNA-binding regulator protein Hfq